MTISDEARKAEFWKSECARLVKALEEHGHNSEIARQGACGMCHAVLAHKSAVEREGM